MRLKASHTSIFRPQNLHFVTDFTIVCTTVFTAIPAKALMIQALSSLRIGLRRMPQASEIVRMNRQQGPDVILDLLEQRAPHGFGNIEDVMPRAELAAILDRYKQAAGHAQTPVRSAAGRP